MAEYIEREAAQTSCRKYSFAESYDAFAVDCILKAIPAADVTPVRHGRWITTSVEVFHGSSQFLCYAHKHEECGFQYVDMDENEYDHCPKCGAKMEGGVYDACL